MDLSCHANLARGKLPSHTSPTHSPPFPSNPPYTHACLDPNVSCDGHQLRPLLYPVRLHTPLPPPIPPPTQHAFLDPDVFCVLPAASLALPCLVYTHPYPPPKKRYMAELSKHVPIIPVIMKADTMTIHEAQRFRQEVVNRLQNPSEWGTHTPGTKPW